MNRGRSRAGRKLRPCRARSTARAHSRPSAIAVTIRSAPRTQSPQAHTPSTSVAKRASTAHRRARRQRHAEVVVDRVVGLDAGEADRQQHQVDVQRHLAAVDGDGLGRGRRSRRSPGTRRAAHAAGAAARPRPRSRSSRAATRGAALLVGAVRAQQRAATRATSAAGVRSRGGVGPWAISCTRGRALAQRVAEAVRARVAAAEDDHAPAGRRDRVGLHRQAGHAAVLRDEVRHGVLDAGELAARQVEVGDGAGRPWPGSARRRRRAARRPARRGRSRRRSRSARPRRRAARAGGRARPCRT